MTEQLSRVRSRQKQTKSEGQQRSVRSASEPASEAAARTGRPAVPGTLSRKDRLARSRSAVKPEQEGRQPEGEETPSRTQTYPSERIRFSKMFVNSLIVLFLMLLAFLLYWGIEGAPPLRELFQ